MSQLTKVLAQLQDESTAPGELVGLIDKLEHQYSVIADLATFARTGQAPNVTEFISGDGMSALVHIAVTGWPADGNLAASKHPYDTVTDVGAAALQHEADSMPAVKGVKRSGPKWRSPRRRAIVCLSVMGHYRPYLEEMERVGFFAPDMLPAMLESSFAHVDYSLHNKGFEFFHAKDQTQTVVVNLLNLMASAITCSSHLMEYCRQHTAMNICRLYTDPFQLWVDKCHADRQALAARYRKKGWNEDRISDAVHQVKERQSTQEDKFGQDECFFELGGLDYNVVRFFKSLIKACTDDELLQLIHQGGLITLLKGCISQSRPNMSQDSPADAIDMLTDVWTNKAAEVSKKLFERIESEESQALGLRQKGNDAFKAGQLQQALDFYWQAVSHNPQDYALFNNISLVALKKGDVKQALQAAEESVKLAPTVYKSWCRMGDAFRAIKRWQLAHLTYTCAHELAPHDEDVKNRQEEARSYLAEVWAINDIPTYAQHDPSDMIASMMSAFKWMGVSDPGKIMKHMLTGNKIDSGPSAVFLNKYGATSRYWACTSLKSEITYARAMAVASGLLRPSTLPRSCAGLKRPDQLPFVWEQWSVSWTDMPLRHRQSGLVRHMLTVASSSTGMIKAHLMTLGTPGLHSVKRVVLQAMLNPMDIAPGRPKELFLAHRLFPLVHKMRDMCKPWGVTVAAETATEAQQTCKNMDTHPQGHNHEGSYTDEDDGHAMFDKNAKDPNNGHKKT